MNKTHHNNKRGITGMRRKKEKIEDMVTVVRALLGSMFMHAHRMFNSACLCMKIRTCDVPI